LDRERCGVEWCAPESSDGRQSRVAGARVEWSALKASSRQRRRMVGSGGEWWWVWGVEANGGRQRQELDAKAEYWVAEANGGWWMPKLNCERRRQVAGAEAE